MTFRTKLLCFTAAIGLSAGAAFAAIDGNQLADDYLAQGYSFVEVKIGPTQTKVEAIKGATKVEVIYDNETGDIISQETETVAGDDATRTGKEVKSVGRDFENRDDRENDDADDDDRGGKGDDGDRGDDGDDDDDDDDDDGDDDEDDDGGKGDGGKGKD